MLLQARDGCDLAGRRYSFPCERQNIKQRRKCCVETCQLGASLGFADGPNNRIFVRKRKESHSLTEWNSWKTVSQRERSLRHWPETRRLISASAWWSVYRECPPETRAAILAHNCGRAEEQRSLPSNLPDRSPGKPTLSNPLGLIAYWLSKTRLTRSSRSPKGHRASLDHHHYKVDRCLAESKGLQKEALLSGGSFYYWDWTTHTLRPRPAPVLSTRLPRWLSNSGG